jgi:hypothetical protein
MKEKKKSLPNEVTSKLWQKIKNDPELYEEKKRKRKIWFNKPEVAERRKAKLKEQYRKRKEENPEEYRRLRDIENNRRVGNSRYGGLTFKEWREQNPDLYEKKVELARKRQIEKKLLGIPDPKKKERQRRWYIKKKYGNYDKVVGTKTYDNKVDAEVSGEFLKKIWNKGTSNKVVKETKNLIDNVIQKYGGMKNVSDYWH